MCDTAYVLQIEAIERQVLSDRQVAALARVNGHDLHMPDVAEAIAEFDAALVAEPEFIDTGSLELRQLMGVA